MTYLPASWIIGCEMPRVSREHEVKHEDEKEEEEEQEEEEEVELACGPSTVEPVAIGELVRRSLRSFFSSDNRHRNNYGRGLRNEWNAVCHPANSRR